MAHVHGSTTVLFLLLASYLPGISLKPVQDNLSPSDQTKNSQPTPGNPSGGTSSQVIDNDSPQITGNKTSELSESLSTTFDGSASSPIQPFLKQGIAYPTQPDGNTLTPQAPPQGDPSSNQPSGNYFPSTPQGGGSAPPASCGNFPPQYPQQGGVVPSQPYGYPPPPPYPQQGGAVPSQFYGYPPPPPFPQQGGTGSLPYQYFPPPPPVNQDGAAQPPDSYGYPPPLPLPPSYTQTDQVPPPYSYPSSFPQGSAGYPPPDVNGYPPPLPPPGLPFGPLGPPPPPPPGLPFGPRGPPLPPPLPGRPLGPGGPLPIGPRAGRRPPRSNSVESSNFFSKRGIVTRRSPTISLPFLSRSIV